MNELAQPTLEEIETPQNTETNDEDEIFDGVSEEAWTENYTFSTCIECIAGDEDRVYLEGPISTALIENYTRAVNFLEDPEIAALLDLDPDTLEPIDVEYLTNAAEKLNKGFSAGEDPPLSLKFVKEMKKATDLYYEIHKRLILKNPERIIDSVEEELRQMYPDLGEDFDEFFEIIESNPELIISSYRWNRNNTHEVLQPAEVGSAVKVDDKKLEELWDFVDESPFSFKGHYQYPIYRKVPEMPRTLDCLYSYAMGNRDVDRFKRVIQRGYNEKPGTDPEVITRRRDGYIPSHWGDTENAPYSGLKVHVYVDLRDPKFPNMLKTVADTAQQFDTDGMKVQRFSPQELYVRNEKGITIYPNIGHSGEKIGPTANFDNAISIASAVDKALVQKFQKDFPEPYPTDLSVGQSNMVSIRYAALNHTEQEGDTRVIEGAEWKDSRRKSFTENLPQTEMLDQIQHIAQEKGLELAL